MDARKLLLLIMALIMAGVSAVVARSYFGGGSEAEAAPAAAPAPEPTGPEVLVAVRPLPVGSIIGPETFRYQRWPAELVNKTYYVKGEIDLATLNGTVVRSGLTAGEPLPRARW